MIILPSELSQKIPGETKIETRKTNHIHSKHPMHFINNVNEGMTHTRPLIPDVPFHIGPTYRSPPKPIRSDMSRGQEGSQSSPSPENISSDINLDFEENSPFQEGVISKAYQRLDKSFFQEVSKLNDLINTGNLIQKCLPNQVDIDKILKIIQRKVLTCTHFPVEIKEIQAGYLNSPYSRTLIYIQHQIGYLLLKQQLEK